MEGVQTIQEILQSPPEVGSTRDSSQFLPSDLRIPFKLTSFTVAKSSSPGWSKHFSRLSGIIGTGFVSGFLGVCGTGKSQLGASLCKYAAHQGKKATMLEAMELCDSVKDTFGTSDRQIMFQFHRPDLLVIDEVNTGLSEYDIRLIQRIVSRRYDTSRQDTILISNETPEEFCRLVGDRVVSRINEAGQIVLADWSSFR